MTKPTSMRLFRNLWRFNAVAIALASLVVLAFGAVAGTLMARDLLRTRSVASIAAVPRPADDGRSLPRNPAKLETLHFTGVAGHDVMWSAMTSRETVDGKYYDKQATNTRDILFYDMKTGQYRRLLGRDDWLIPLSSFIAASAAPPTTTPAPSGPPATSSAVALLLTLVEADTDGDGRLSQSDAKSVALARPDGSGLVKIAGNVERLVGHVVGGDGSSLVVMVNDAAGSTRALKIGLSDFRILREDRFGPQAAGPG